MVPVFTVMLTGDGTHLDGELMSWVCNTYCDPASRPIRLGSLKQLHSDIIYMPQSLPGPNVPSSGFQ